MGTGPTSQNIWTHTSHYMYTRINIADINAFCRYKIYREHCRVLVCGLLMKLLCVCVQCTPHRQTTAKQVHDDSRPSGVRSSPFQGSCVVLNDTGNWSCSHQGRQGVGAFASILQPSCVSRTVGAHKNQHIQFFRLEGGGLINMQVYQTSVTVTLSNRTR